MSEKQKTDWQRKKHDSPETAEFRNRIENFIKECNIDSENQYHLKNNLSLIIRLPYYCKSKGTRPKGHYNHSKIMLDFCRYLIQYNDSEFTELLLTDLSVQQNQSLRKIAKQRKDLKKISSSEGIWEHIIPVKVVRDKLVEIINSKNEPVDKIKEIEHILKLYSKAGQIHITKEDDKKLKNSNYNESMPSDWDWTEEKIFSRYVKSGINLKKYIKEWEKY